MWEVTICRNGLTSGERMNALSNAGLSALGGLRKAGAGS